MTLYPHRRPLTFIACVVITAFLVAAIASDKGWYAIGLALLLGFVAMRWWHRVDLARDDRSVTVSWRGYTRGPEVSFDLSSVVGVFAEKRADAQHDRLVITIKLPDGNLRDLPLFNDDRGSLYMAYGNQRLETIADEVRTFLGLPTN